MNYEELARELFNNMEKLHRSKPQKNITGSMEGEKSILRFLSFNRDKDVLPGDISEELNISSARVAAALNRLEEKGLVTRSIDPEDRRRFIVSLTEKGKSETEIHAKKMMERVVTLLKELGEHDAVEYVRIMGRVADIMDKNNLCEK